MPVKSHLGIGPNIVHVLRDFPLNGIPSHFSSPLGNFLVWGDHFANYIGPATAGTAGGWILSEVAAGAGNVNSVSLAAAIGGVLQLKSDDGSGDNECLQSVQFPFVYKVGKRLWYITRVGFSAATGSLGFFGLASADTNPFSTFPTNGLFFEKAATALQMDFHARKSGTSTEKTALGPTLQGASITNFVISNLMYYAFTVSETGQVDVWAGNSLKTLSRVASIPSTDANLPDNAMLALHFAFQTNAAASRSLFVDMFMVAMEI